MLRLKQIILNLFFIFIFFCASWQLNLKFIPKVFLFVASPVLADDGSATCSKVGDDCCPANLFKLRLKNYCDKFNLKCNSNQKCEEKKCEDYGKNTCELRNDCYWNLANNRCTEKPLCIGRCTANECNSLTEKEDLSKWCIDRDRPICCVPKTIQQPLCRSENQSCGQVGLIFLGDCCIQDSLECIDNICVKIEIPTAPIILKACGDINYPFEDCPSDRCEVIGHECVDKQETAYERCMSSCYGSPGICNERCGGDTRPKPCPNNCSGHGTCDTRTGICACDNDNFASNDCSSCKNNFNIYSNCESCLPGYYGYTCENKHCKTSLDCKLGEYCNTTTGICELESEFDKCIANCMKNPNMSDVACLSQCASLKTQTPIPQTPQSKQCSANCNCDASGNCTSCKSGYYGTNCANSCGSGYWCANEDQCEAAGGTLDKNAVICCSSGEGICNLGGGGGKTGPESCGSDYRWCNNGGCCVPKDQDDTKCGCGGVCSEENKEKVVMQKAEEINDSEADGFKDIELTVNVPDIFVSPWKVTRCTQTQDWKGAEGCETIEYGLYNWSSGDPSNPGIKTYVHKIRSKTEADKYLAEDGYYYIANGNPKCSWSDTYAKFTAQKFDDQDRQDDLAPSCSVSQNQNQIVQGQRMKFVCQIANSNITKVNFILAKLEGGEFKNTNFKTLSPIDVVNGKAVWNPVLTISEGRYKVKCLSVE